MHIKQVHAKIKDHQCQLCNYAASENQSLIRHLGCGMLLQFQTHYKKWISTEDLKNIRESVLVPGVEVEALEYQFPCLVVK